jgi:hypothetical protein
MPRYMWRKYNQNSKKRSQLDSPEHGESRKVPLTPAERAKAYREQKRLRGLDQPSTSTAALWNPYNETPMECSGSEATSPMECTGSENDVVMMDSPEISIVQSREDFDTDGHVAIVTLTRRPWRTTLVMLAMCAIDFGLEKT